MCQNNLLKEEAGAIYFKELHKNSCSMHLHIIWKTCSRISEKKFCLFMYENNPQTEENCAIYIRTCLKILVPCTYTSRRGDLMQR
jgi:hypothetical protein